MGKYLLVTVYDDYATKGESVKDLRAALTAAIVYMEDKSCEHIAIWNDSIRVMDWWRCDENDD